VATVHVTQDDRLVRMLEPSRRTLPTQRQTMTKAAIHTNGFTDIDGGAGGARDGGAVMPGRCNPRAFWIWFGGLTMALGCHRWSITGRGSGPRVRVPVAD